ncbi:MAG TPA: type II toxin-antitoxin system prevent-host-death family antitoxin [Candidatus Saccharimonadales bacterium]|nr:type II toxin-antitoxin system prevent-host-death family antitoxin [Candidatus Saccharimonadales bacterium]
MGMTQVMKSSDVRMQWSQLLNKVFNGNTRVVVERRGIPVAAVISVDDLKRFTLIEEQRNERFKALDKIRESFKDVSSEELEREINEAITQIRLKKTPKEN